MNINLPYPFSLAIVVALLTGCATPHKLDQTTSINQQQYQNNIQINGKISVQYLKDGETENIHGSYEWSQKNDEISLELSSPLGQTITQIKQNNQFATLTDSNKETHTANNIEQLLSKTVGWSIPASGLKNWLQGFYVNEQYQLTAVPSIDNQLINTEGWHLRYTSWQQEQGKTLPKRIDLSRNTEYLGEIKIRIVVNEWNSIQ